MSLSDLLPDAEAIIDRFHESGVAPGCAFGLIVDGALVHTTGRGTLRVGETAVPGADSVFRIASMTKSFTAAAVLGLRDEAVLRLDDEVGQWVPELASLPRTPGDAPPITIRHLLSMSAGLPTDDPWGDRQQDLAEDAFLAFLSRGPQLAWPTGTRFEYSNLGFAILGLVIARAAGQPYRTVVEERLLGPLGLASTGYEVMGADPSRVAVGYVRRGDTWAEEPMAGHGAFAPMGGLFSTVRDLSAWVAWLADAFPARDDPDPSRPLRRASRREMQQVQRIVVPDLSWASAAEPPTGGVFGYGYGLFGTFDVRRGRLVSHGGGYPGYGSHMRWHPATGLGVVAVANGRYAGPAEACREILELLIDREVRPARRPAPWPETIAARTAVDRLIDGWDDAAAADLFAMNVALDEDLASRRSAMERLRATHGRLRPDSLEPASSWSAADLRWRLAGDRGTVGVEIILTPERPARVQSLELTSVPEPPLALIAVAERIVELVAQRCPAWPEDLLLAATVDRARLDRELRATEAVFGPLTLGPVTGGDGEREAAWRLRGPNGDVALTLELDAHGAIGRAALVPVTREAPAHLD